MSSSSSSSCSSSSDSSSSRTFEWKAWPGGHLTPSTNPKETFDSSDFGFTGNVDWDIGQGGNSGAIIEQTGGTTATNRSSIRVRYDAASADASEDETVWIQAIKDDVTETKKRTVFKVTWDPGNFSNTVDADNNLRFPITSGTDRDKAEFNWDGENGATKTSAKMEAILNFSPTGIDWDARGVSFVYSTSGGSKFRFRLHRQRIWTVVGQSTSGSNRTVVYNDSDWVYDGNSDSGDAQYPTVAKPNEAFRIDAPSFNAAGWKQIGFRLDLRELTEWHNGSGWSRCSQYLGWYANETSVLPNGAKGGTNNHGAGTATNVPNTAPVANAGSDQSVGTGSQVTLNGSGSSDADNDTLTYSWQQISGTPVTLSDTTAQQPTFTAPGTACTLIFGLKVSDITKNLHYHNPGTYESTEDTVTVEVS